MGSTIKSLSKAKTQLDTLTTKMKSYATRIEDLNKELNLMMKGDGNMSYWVGENAYKWYGTAIKRLNTLIGNYKNCYNEFADYAKMYDKAYAKSKLKLTATQLKGLSSKFDGSAYTSKVKKSLDDKKITAVATTVVRDAANDDQTIKSYQCYKALKDSLEDLESSCKSLSTTWSNVASNTTGTMQSDAKKRVSAMTDRKKNVVNMMDNLEEDYIGDMLFSK